MGVTIETRVAVAAKYLESKGVKSTVTPEGQMETDFGGVEVFETGKRWVAPHWLVAKQQNMQVAIENKDVPEKAAATDTKDEKTTKEKAAKEKAAKEKVAKEKAAKKEKADKELAKKKAKVAAKLAAKKKVE